MVPILEQLKNIAEQIQNEMDTIDVLYCEEQLKKFGALLNAKQDIDEIIDNMQNDCE
jgi:hypothetical protein